MLDPSEVHEISASSRRGGVRAIFERACLSVASGERATLAIVLEAEGSTYVLAGACALFTASVQVGWLSGGCLEEEIAKRAELAARKGSIEWMEVDTREDGAMFGGSAMGCRGRLRLALLPLTAMPGWEDVARAWLERQGPMRFAISSQAEICCEAGSGSGDWTLPAAEIEWENEPSSKICWQMTIDTPPSVLLFGSGPEVPILLPMLHSMGWMTTTIERRPRWQANARLADVCLGGVPAQTVTSLANANHTAALVMHHNFELDLEALQALSASSIPFIGLLGPNRRREDLFMLLPETTRASLLPRLHSPVGMDLGGRGPETIALSIAAQLHSILHPR